MYSLVYTTLVAIQNRTYLTKAELIETERDPIVGDLVYGSDSYYAQIIRVGEGVVEITVIGQIANLQAIYDLLDLKANKDEIAELVKVDETTIDKNTLNELKIAQQVLDLINDKIEQNALDGFVYQPTFDKETHTLTLPMQNEMSLVIDLDLERLIMNIDLEDNELVFTFEDGSVKRIPLGSLLVGMASEQWVNDKLAFKADKQQENWLTPTLLNGTTGDVKYMKDNFGFVHFKGSITTVIPAISNVVIKLPVGYRPQSQDTLFPVVKGDFLSLTTILVSNNGDTLCGYQGKVFLDGITFKEEDL